jgi:uncharacterized protein
MPSVTVEVLTTGRALGEVILVEPLSFWGGFDSSTGTVNEPSHPQYGMVLSDKIVVMTCGRGSSSSSSVLAEAVRAGTAPAAFVFQEVDAILAVGALVAEELYARACPMVVLPRDHWPILRNGLWVEVIAHEGNASLVISSA